MLSITGQRQALAAYDMTGSWWIDTPYLYGDRWEVEQTSDDLSVTMTYSGLPKLATGSIEQATADFHLEIPEFYEKCGDDSLDGHLSADGKSFLATQQHWFLHVTPRDRYCVEVTFSVVGSRCGNDEFDDGEECDDGNQLSGDCCSASCILDPSGTACPVDANVCTDDVCDGAGGCVHPDNAAPCEDAAGCGTGTCAAGQCVISAPEPAAAPCDLDASICTLDTCDGAGTCLPGAEVDCAPCGVCESALGCIGAFDDDPCDWDVEHGSLSLRLDAAESRRLSATFEDSFDPAEDFGDPTTDTDITLCLYQNGQYEDDPRRPVILEATVPAGGSCGGEACWRGSFRGYTYRTKPAGAEGISLIRLRPGGVRVRGKGAGLSLPFGFPDKKISIFQKVIASDGVTSSCWIHEVGYRTKTESRFQGSF